MFKRNAPTFPQAMQYSEVVPSSDPLHTPRILLHYPGYSISVNVPLLLVMLVMLVLVLVVLVMLVMKSSPWPKEHKAPGTRTLPATPFK
jgi:hypothetical protein